MQHTRRKKKKLADRHFSFLQKVFIDKSMKAKATIRFFPVLMKVFFLVFGGALFLSSRFPTSSIILENDSRFVLTAIVLAQDGGFLAQQTLEPTGNMQDSKRKPIKLAIPSYAYAKTRTPYTVVWRCPNGSDYSVVRGISAGGLVRANSGEGVHSCSSKRRNRSKN